MISKVTAREKEVTFEIIYTNTILLCVRTVRFLAREEVTFEIIYTNTIILCVRTVRFLAYRSDTQYNCVGVNDFKGYLLTT
jgi:predicted DCC family thiol-disulfide oxidoreductase YuxK